MVLGAVGTMIKQKIIGKAFEKGEDEFVSYARGLGKTEKEMGEFADAASKLFDLTVMAGAVTGIARGRSRKRTGSTPKTPGKTANAAAGMAKGALGGPNPKPTKAPKASKSSATVRETELVGTGMKVKVPVEEVPSPAARALTKARKGDGKDGTNKAPKTEKPVEKPAQKERIVRTRRDVNDYFDRLKKDPKWRFNKEDKTYVNKTTGEKRWGDYLHNEIDCNKGDKAWVIDPVMGKVLDKKGHLLRKREWVRVAKMQKWKCAGM